MLDAPNAAANSLANDRRIDALLLHRELEEFNNAYAAALDEQRLSDWAEMFTDDAFYVVISRENADRGMPVGLIYCENKAMILDRAFAHTKTEMFAPRYLRHIVGNLQMLGEEPQRRHPRPRQLCRRPGVVRPARRQAAPGRRLLRQVPPHRRSAQARRAALRLRQSAGRQRALPAGLSAWLRARDPQQPLTSPETKSSQRPARPAARRLTRQRSRRSRRCRVRWAFRPGSSSRRRRRSPGR